VSFKEEAGEDMGSAPTAHPQPHTHTEFERKTGQKGKELSAQEMEAIHAQLLDLLLKRGHLALDEKSSPRPPLSHRPLTSASHTSASSIGQFRATSPPPLKPEQKGSGTFGAWPALVKSAKVGLTNDVQREKSEKRRGEKRVNDSRPAAGKGSSLKPGQGAVFDPSSAEFAKFQQDLLRAQREASAKRDKTLAPHDHSAVPSVPLADSVNRRGGDRQDGNTSTRGSENNFRRTKGHPPQATKAADPNRTEPLMASPPPGSPGYEIGSSFEDEAPGGVGEGAEGSDNKARGEPGSSPRSLSSRVAAQRGSQRSLDLWAAEEAWKLQVWLLLLVAVGSDT
jgi:hypothetical protein